ncbi:energy-coupling factor transporter transmembrane component T family protein [Salinarimonas sp.]|uniref:energy-coupling factor transporter transmembrane component T family protein n=1 Tax=Salinarimonas sp. TaxID=2766526 RepID=UPI00391A5C3D
MLALHRPGTSPIHRLPAGAKLIALGLAGTAIVLADALPLLAAALLAAILLYRAAALPLALAGAQLRPLALVLTILLLVQGLVVSWEAGLALVLRFSTLILLAGLVSLTTPVSAMTDALARGLAPLRAVGVSPVRVAFAIALAVRFVPVIAQIVGEIREAQAARGRERSLVALAVPLVIRTLAMSDAVAEAIEARGGLDEGPHEVDAPERPA